MKTKPEPIPTSIPNTTRYVHDAFGVITLMTPQVVQSGTLFGSQVSHHSHVSIQVHRAHLDRSLSRDWIQSDGAPMLEIHLTRSQFAEFITSAGRGEGTPCTLVRAPARNAEIDLMPEIQELESKTEMMRREVEEKAAESIAGLKEQIEALGILINEGKLTKTAAKEIHRSLSIQAENLPKNMQFVTKQAHSAIETASAQARIEIEATVDLAVKRLGLNAAQARDLLPNTKEEA